MYSSATLVFLWMYVNVAFQYIRGSHQSIEEKVFYSDVFAYGRVRASWRNDSGSDSTYTVETDVYCVFKGGPLPRVINITVQEYSSQFCLYSSFQEGRKYLLYLDRVGFELRPAFSGQRLREHEEVDYVSFLCGMDIQYPTGMVEQDAPEMCPEPYPDFPECARYTPELEHTEDEADLPEVTLSSETSRDPPELTPSFGTSRITGRRNDDVTLRTVMTDVINTSPVNSASIVSTETTEQVCASTAKLCFSENLIAVILLTLYTFMK